MPNHTQALRQPRASNQAGLADRRIRFLNRVASIPWPPPNVTAIAPHPRLTAQKKLSPTRQSSRCPPHQSASHRLGLSQRKSASSTRPTNAKASDPQGAS
ncbi:hypothetical protein BU16DRAFT_527201 [Lophium mytilinum]|uniref:Uncharacterized protein n=1 Tax=Lophium mytilinum TaxID=390894 RepID=A0A6A6QSF0_9PEZI|nr:hypothetical protein BU16DRAFT_527201 [Lophium mytilinum]